jgi:hypothetical protein
MNKGFEASVRRLLANSTPVRECFVHYLIGAASRLPVIKSHQPNIRKDI